MSFDTSKTKQIDIEDVKVLSKLDFVNCYNTLHTSKKSGDVLKNYYNTLDPV